MTSLQAWQKYWNCYQIAVQAESLFTAGTVRQFGKRAGDMRYVPAAFDFATCCAAEIKHRADADAKSALDAARAFPATGFKRNECDCETVAVSGEVIHELTCAMFDGLPLNARFGAQEASR